MRRFAPARNACTLAVMLALAALACNMAALNEPDSQATVAAVYATITAQAAMAGPPDGPSSGAVLPTPLPDDATTPGGTPAPTDAASSPTPSATPPESRTGNGENVTVRRCQRSISVDGSRADWEPLAGVARFGLGHVVYGAGSRTGPDDLSGEAWACWTDSALYLFVQVVDDVHVQTQSGATAWRGDEVEIVFDGDLQGDFYATRWSDDDVQLGLSPGDFASLPPSAVRYHPSVRNAPEVSIAAQRPADAAGGYSLEAAIPWSTLGVTLQTGVGYGFCIALSDNDQPGTANQESMVSNCPNLRVTNPTTWATIELAD